MGKDEELSELLADVKLDEDLVEIIPRYVVNVRKDLAQLNDSLEKKDMKSVGMIGHRLKGSASSYGFDAIDLIAKNIQQHADGNEIDEVKNDVFLLKEYLLKIDEELERAG